MENLRRARRTLAVAALVLAAVGCTGSPLQTFSRLPPQTEPEPVVAESLPLTDASDADEPADPESEQERQGVDFDFAEPQE